jgi:hypothetical protein
MRADQTMSMDLGKSVKTALDPPAPPDLGQPQRYRRRGVVTAIQYTGMNRGALIDHAGAYVVNEDDALCVSVDGKQVRLFPGDVTLLRLGSKDPDERCEGVIGAAVWAADYELVP